MKYLSKAQATMLNNKVRMDILKKHPQLRDVMSKTNFTAYPFKKSCYGDYTFSTGMVRLNLSMFTENELDRAEDTIRHEYAHAVDYHVYGGRGHGKSWKRAAVMLGATPKARGKVVSEAIQEERKVNGVYKWVVTLDGQPVAYYKRKPTRDFSRCTVNGDRSTLGKLILKKL